MVSNGGFYSTHTVLDSNTGNIVGDDYQIYDTFCNKMAYRSTVPPTNYFLFNNESRNKHKELPFFFLDSGLFAKWMILFAFIKN